MTWTTPQQLLAQIWRRWERGDILADLVLGDIVWPLKLTLKRPTAAELTDQFPAVQAWVGKIGAAHHIRIEWRELTHRVHGRQRIPDGAWVESSQDAIAAIGQQATTAQFMQLLELIAAKQPSLVPWLAQRPLAALELAGRWPKLLAVIAWLQAHPRPGVFIRQVDAPGVDTKFIWDHRVVLAELLDLALPATAIDADATGAGSFGRRYGFRPKPTLIRFRLLDPDLPSFPGCSSLSDITLDAASFAAVTLPVDRVFITENEANFLAFAPAAKAIVIFGKGYGWDALAQATWLHQRQLWYWGDLDTHGFAILSQLRGHMPHVQSILMDRETLLEHRAHWGKEPDQATHDLPHLTESEVEVYNDLRFNRLQPQLRLEQEHLGFAWVNAHLRQVKGC